MKEAHLSALIRPVHPEFYVRQESPGQAAKESSVAHTLLQIDPLLELWPRKSARRDSLGGITHIEPVDARSWRAFIQNCFDLASAKHALGIKQQQAHRRALDFAARRDSEVVWARDPGRPAR